MGPASKCARSSSSPVVWETSPRQASSSRMCSVMMRSLCQSPAIVLVPYLYMREVRAQKSRWARGAEARVGAEGWTSYEGSNRLGLSHAQRLPKRYWEESESALRQAKDLYQAEITASLRSPNRPPHAFARARTPAAQPAATVPSRHVRLRHLAQAPEAGTRRVELPSIRAHWRGRAQPPYRHPLLRRSELGAATPRCAPRVPPPTNPTAGTLPAARWLKAQSPGRSVRQPSEVAQANPHTCRRHAKSELAHRPKERWRGGRQEWSSLTRQAHQ